MVCFVNKQKCTNVVTENLPEAWRSWLHMACILYILALITLKWNIFKLHLRILGLYVCAYV